MWGSGTQDILVWRANQRVENCPKLILPSPTTIISRQIRAATKKGHHLFLAGHTMGGGASTKAVREHVSAGLKVFALEQPALTFHDRMDKGRCHGHRNCRSETVHRTPDTAGNGRFGPAGHRPGPGTFFTNPCLKQLPWPSRTTDFRRL